MTEQEVKEAMAKGFNSIKPKIGDMTNLMMDCYQIGFKTCWKLVTGMDFDHE